MLAASIPAFWPAIAKGVIPAVEHIQAISSLKPKTLIDVGANKGQFSIVAHHLFRDIDIHAFEPLEGERKIYQSVVLAPTKFYSIALGAQAGERNFFITARADSSSLLQPSEMSEPVSYLTVTSSVVVPVKRLSDVIDPSVMASPILMKIDVQGGELDVLKGASDILPLIDAIYCEVSFVRLYKNQPLAEDVVSYLAQHGFALRGVFNQSVTRSLGPIQADFLFTRQEPK